MRLALVRRAARSPKRIGHAARRRSCASRQRAAKEKGTYWVPSVGGLVLPAINASSGAAAVELEETLLTHHIGRVEKGLLIEVRKRLLQTLQLRPLRRLLSTFVIAV